jgi:DNA-binding winged helix-turn-helix (wHTH) protein
METNSSRRLFRFGVFEVDQQTEELRKQGRRLLLQGQPLQVLLLLLNRPGQLVTRGEIHQALWPDGTFVDFDHSLNTAVNKIREALGDSAASPRFVETLARRGYRFIASVEVLDDTPAPRTQRDPALQQTPPGLPQPMPADRLATPTVSALTRRLLTSPSDIPQASPRLVRLLFLLLQVMYLCFYGFSLARLSVAQEIIRSMLPHSFWAVVLIIVTAVVGIPIRLYLITALAFHAPGLREKFLRLFPAIFPLDELWALAPFLLVEQIGLGLALAVTAALLYVPFAQRSLILMGAGMPANAKPAAS